MPYVMPLCDVMQMSHYIYLTVLIYFFALSTGREEEEEEPLVIPDPLPKHDMTLDELRKYDGKGADKRVCIAILGRVYDCTKSECSSPGVFAFFAY